MSFLSLKKREECELTKANASSFFDDVGFDMPEPLIRVIASRKVDPSETKRFLTSTLDDITAAKHLPDCEIAAKRIADQVVANKPIGIECDYDTDGATGGATLYLALRDYFCVPEHLIKVFVGHRLTEGYGLSQGLAERILATPSDERPDLVVTVDNGSSDAERITFLKQHGIDVIVTDHHEIPSTGIPKDAVAVVSPARKDSEFGDPKIAGCAVAWLLACRVHDYLMFMGHSMASTQHPTELLSYVAVGTVADCVSLSESINNRAIVSYGLFELNRSNRPCWAAFRANKLQSNQPFLSDTLGFGIGPMINAAGRIADPLTAINYLTTTETSQATKLFFELSEDNDYRKEIEKEMRDAALLAAESQAAEGNPMMVVFLPDGHPGVHGISASRVVERTGRPTAIFSPKTPDGKIITASLRSIDDIHIRDVLEYVAGKVGDAMIAFGGHKMAGGCTLKHSALKDFTKHANDAVSIQLKAISRDKDSLKPIVEHDGELSPDWLNLNFVDVIQKLGPYGRGFDAPSFTIKARVAHMQYMGAEKNHLKLNIQTANGAYHEAVWFFAKDNPDHANLHIDRTYMLLIELNKNFWAGSERLQLMVKSITPCN